MSARCAIFPRTPEPSVTTARCLFAAAPGPTLRPAPSASTQTFPTDAARQANFLRCRSADTFQVERCTFFHAPDHSTRTCTRTFARALTRFATAGGVNLPPQTLTAAPILVNASSGLVGCFPIGLGLASRFSGSSECAWRFEIYSTSRPRGAPEGGRGAAGDWGESCKAVVYSIGLVPTT